jgi:hypothetical protein
VISQTFVAGRLVGLKEFEHHKREDERLHLGTKYSTSESSRDLTTHSPANNPSCDDDKHSRGVRPPSLDGQTSKSAQRHERNIFKGFKTLLDLQDKVHTLGTRWEHIQSTLDDLVFVHPPSDLCDSPMPEGHTSGNTSRVLNDGPYALRYDTPSNAPLIHYEEELLQLLHASDVIPDSGDEELRDAKLVLAREVESKVCEIEQIKEKAWQRMKQTRGAGTAGTNIYTIETGMQTVPRSVVLRLSDSIIFFQPNSISAIGKPGIPLSRYATS